MSDINAAPAAEIHRSSSERLSFGVLRENKDGETRVAITPDIVKRLVKKGYQVRVENGAGERAGIPDADFTKEGAEMVAGSKALMADVLLKIHRPTDSEINSMKKGSMLICMAEPFRSDNFFNNLNNAEISCCALEMIPRTSRAQSMDVLSSQANIAGYRAVIEGISRYIRFCPMMMTSAGSAKPAQVVVLGAGVAGLQAIGTAKRLGAQVWSYDVRPEVKEQIQSLGAKFIDLDVGESGTGQGGYAKELSEQAKKKQQELLSERLMKADVIISTANIPGKKAPVLITEKTVQGMRTGSVIVDMAAANGGNCPLSEADKVVTKNGVVLVGHTNYPAMVPFDASSFFAKNIWNLLSLMVTDQPQQLNISFADDILDAAFLTFKGKSRNKKA